MKVKVIINHIEAKFMTIANYELDSEYDDAFCDYVLGRMSIQYVSRVSDAVSNYFNKNTDININKQYIFNFSKNIVKLISVEDVSSNIPLNDYTIKSCFESISYLDKGIDIEIYLNFLKSIGVDIIDNSSLKPSKLLELALSRRESCGGL